MIQSRHRTWSFWILTFLSCFFLLIIISSISQYFLGLRILGMEIKDFNEFLLQFFFWFTMFSMIIAALWHNVKNIQLDTNNKTISFQNIFTRKSQFYNFTDFDGYIDTSIKHDGSGSSYATIGFVKGKKVVRRIDSYFYSNYDEIKSGLINCNYLGAIRFGTWKSIKMMLNYDVLE